MARAALIQNALNAGELSNLLLGRQDISKYATGLYVCLNAVPLTQGAWTRRPGTVFLHQTKYHNRESRLFPFQYSVTQTYVLEFGHQYIRFFTDHGILTTNTQNISAVTKAATGVLTYSGADSYANTNRVHIASAGGMTQINNREFVVTNVNTGANTFELYDSDGTAVNSTNYDTYTSGGTVSKIYEVATAFDESDLADIRIVQSADTLYILHPDFPPQTLVRNSATSWTLSEVSFTDGPYFATNTTATTLSPAAATGSGVVVTASAVTGINGGQGFLSTDVDRLVRMQEGSVWGWARITTVTSTTQVTVDIQSTLTNTNAKVNWRLGLWSDTTGFPRCGTFFDDRLFLAGAATSPQRLDGSRVGAYTDFGPSRLSDGTVSDSDAVAFTLNADDVNAIKWLGPNEKGLLAGTSRGEWQIKPSALNEAITPTNISGKPSTKHGSADVAPVLAGKAVLFVQRAGRKLRELAYVFEVDGFKAPDMTLLSEHITRPSITELAYQEQPQAVVWSTRSDGVLLSFTYERDQDVVAWARHELGGFSNSGGTAVPVVESVAVVPSPDTTRDELYMVVQRYINGGTKRYVEYMSKLWEIGDEQEDAVHLDCSWSVVNGSPSDSVTGLWHLNGQSVIPYVDGAVHPAVTVTNGAVTLNRTYSVVTLGYAYNSDGMTLPPEGGSQDGTAQAKKKRVHSVGFWLVDTLGLTFGPSLTGTLQPLLQTQWGSNFGEATPLFTGVTSQRFEGNYDLLGQVAWRCSGPFPATVLSVMPQLKTNDG